MNTKMTNFLMVVALTGPIMAQKKPAPQPAATPAAAKPAAPAVAPAVAQPVAAPAVTQPAPAAPAQSKTDSLGFGNAKLSIAAFGGLSLTVAKGTHEKEFESFTTKSAIGQKVTTGSPAFGGAVWYGNRANAIGIEGGYSTVYKNISNTSGVSYTYQLSLIGIQALYRYDIFEGLYAAVGAGVAIATLTAENTAVVTGSLKSSVAPLFSARIGYDYEIMPNLTAGAYLQFSYALVNINDNFGSGTQSYSAANFVVSPIAQVAYKF